MPIIFSTSSLALPGTLAHFTGLSALKNAAVALNPRGNEDVKIVILSAIASWAVRSPEIIQESLLSFFGSGLNEKETLRLLRAKRTGCLNHLRIYMWYLYNEYLMARDLSKRFAFLSSYNLRKSNAEHESKAKSKEIKLQKEDMLLIYLIILNMMKGCGCWHLATLVIIGCCLLLMPLKRQYIITWIHREKVRKCAKILWTFLIVL